VPQDTYLTDDTIRRNIAFGVPGESVDEGAVQRAVEAAQLAEFVATLPDGLEARVGERGVRLSGGQRQRIGIARALYNDPEVLVMDEATSSLDGQTERYVMEAVESLRLSRTIILVAHRMSTVQKCDMLVLLGDGSISAVGTFDELLEQSARFRAMAGDVRSLSEPAGVDAPACPMVAAP
jgi:ABC-type multidrug transport system fused ATPase/permease subunit